MRLSPTLVSVSSWGIPADMAQALFTLLALIVA